MEGQQACEFIVAQDWVGSAENTDKIINSNTSYEVRFLYGF